MPDEILIPPVAPPKPSKVERRRTPPPLWALEDAAIAERLKSRPGRIIAALTGGIASGKSTVSELLTAFGAGQIDFDQLARRAVAPQSAGFEAVVELFGPKVVKDGELDRALIAKKAFKDAELKTALEAVIHPLTWRLMAEELDQIEAPLIVVSVPLLFEAGLETFFSPIILCFCRPEFRLKRLLERGPHKMSRREAARILSSQWPDTDKIIAASHIIDNGGAFIQSIRQCRKLWDGLMMTGSRL